MYCRKSHEVTGYVVEECTILCPNCYEDWVQDFKQKQRTGIYPTLDNPEGKAIFLDEEFDTPQVCHWCKEDIDTEIIIRD